MNDKCLYVLCTLLNEKHKKELDGARLQGRRDIMENLEKYHRMFNLIWKARLIEDPLDKEKEIILGDYVSFIDMLREIDNFEWEYITPHIKIKADKHDVSQMYYNLYAARNTIFAYWPEDAQRTKYLENFDIFMNQTDIKKIYGEKFLNDERLYWK